MKIGDINKALEYTEKRKEFCEYYYPSKEIIAISDERIEMLKKDPSQQKI